MKFEDLVFIPDPTGKVDKQALLRLPNNITISVIQGGVSRTQSSNQYELHVLDDTGFIYKKAYLYEKELMNKINEFIEK